MDFIIGITDVLNAIHNDFLKKPVNNTSKHLREQKCTEYASTYGKF